MNLTGMTKDELIEYWAGDLARLLDLQENPYKAFDLEPIKKALHAIYKIGHDAGVEEEKLRRQLNGEEKGNA